MKKYFFFFITVQQATAREQNSQTVRNYSGQNSDIHTVLFCVSVLTSQDQIKLTDQIRE